MIDPLNRFAFILDHDPEMAEALFDVVTYVSECDDPRNDPQVDRMLEMAYARTEQGTEARRLYRNKRVGRSVSRKRRRSSGQDEETIEATMQV